MKPPRYFTAILLLAGALVAATDMARVIRQSASPAAHAPSSWRP